MPIGRTVHFSFDLWTSPKNLSILGIFCHFIDNSFKSRTILLGVKRLLGSHTGFNSAQIVIEIIQAYNLKDRFGFGMLDNASDNDTCMVHLEHWMIENERYDWEGPNRRLRCFGHVVNLFVTLFFANKPLYSTKKKRVPGAPKVKWIKPGDAVEKVHDIVKFICGSDQRLQEFMRYVAEVGDASLHPVKDNDTRWFSKYLMLVRAILLRNAIDMFVFNHREPEKGSTVHLGDCVMSTDDWNYCIQCTHFLKPLYMLLEDLQGKNATGNLTTPRSSIHHFPY